MSGNVEVVRQAIEAQGSDYLCGRSEEDRSARRVALWDPKCEYTSFIAAVESATYHGHDGIRRYLSDLGERWAEWRAEPEAFVDVRPDTVFVSFRFRAVGKDSGVPVEARLGFGLRAVPRQAAARPHLPEPGGSPRGSGASRA